MKPLQIVGLILGGATSAMLIFFIAGSMLTDPGGTKGLLLVVAWLALPVLLTVLAWFRPAAAYPVLVGVIALVLLAAAVGIPLAEEAWALDEANGPIDLMVYLGALTPLVALGRATPGRAGWLLLITILGSLVLHGISLIVVGQPSVIPVFLVLSLPYLGAAIAFIIAGRQSAATKTPNGARSVVAPPTPTVA